MSGTVLQNLFSVRVPKVPDLAIGATHGRVADTAAHATFIPPPHGQYNLDARRAVVYDQRHSDLQAPAGGVIPAPLSGGSLIRKAPVGRPWGARWSWGGPPANPLSAAILTQPIHAMGGCSPEGCRGPHSPSV